MLSSWLAPLVVLSIAPPPSGVAAQRPVKPKVVAPVPRVAGAPVAPLPPLTAEERQILQSSPEDPVPKLLLGQAPGLEDKHYVVGNEWRLDLYHAKLQGLGGGYVGVGSDQAYLLIGSQRPAVAWLIDYDQQVVDVHRLYHTFFKDAATFEAFRALWTPDGQAQALQVLERELAQDPQKKALLRLYRKVRAKVDKRLTKVQKRYAQAGVPCFLDDTATYSAVRELVRAGRVRALRVDLLAKVGLQGIGAAARKLGVPIRALYLSNAENYWPYSKQFRANVQALPMDDKSLVVRTVSTWGQNADYVYNLQAGKTFQAWLATDWVRSYRDFVHWKLPKGPGDTWLFLTEAQPTPKPPTVKKKG